MTDLLTFKKADTIKPQAGTCPYTGDQPFTGAEYVRQCKLLPYLCSCTYWSNPETFNLCWTKNMEDNLRKES